MQLKLNQSNRELKDKAKSAISGNRLSLTGMFLLNLFVTFVFTSLLGFLANWLQPVSVQGFSVNRVFLDTPALITEIINQMSQNTDPIALGITLLVTFLISFFMVQVWVYGTPWSLLEMVDGGAHHIGRVWSAFTHRPVRHYITNFLAAIVRWFSAFVFYLVLATILFFYYVVVLSTARAAIGQVTGIVVHVLYLLIALLLLFLLALLTSWLYYGFNFIMFPTYDNEETGVFRSLRMSWQLMRGNKWRLFKMGLGYLFLPLIIGGLVSLLMAYFRTAFPQADYYFWAQLGLGLVVTLFLFGNWIKFMVVQAVFYREQTKQYALYLNDHFPGFGAEASDNIADLYHTEDRPQFTADTMAIDASELNALDDSASSSDDYLSEAAFRETYGPDQDDFKAGGEDSYSQTPSTYPESESSDSDLASLDAEDNDDEIMVMAPAGSQDEPARSDSQRDNESDQPDETAYEYADPGYVLDDRQQEEVLPASDIFDLAEDYSQPEASPINEETLPDQAERVPEQVEETQDKATEAAETDHFETRPEEEETSDFDFPVLEESTPSEDSHSSVDKADPEETVEEETEADLASEAVEKKPYDPYGYNTPKKTNFKQAKHKDDILLAADRSAESSYDKSIVNQSDFLDGDPLTSDQEDQDSSDK
ncbi:MULTISPECIES: DUF975 family protein [Aerococcus]|uniref:DUF975 family protein n=1 Tax=Aerococcus urinae (strain CCUG 59500 / ACS-120-V-Col10a) TaxID=2976812 RepID=UPI000200F3A2|nr:DUF975 family protein [Aerococcus sp. Group 1]AEA01561.1 hypothetical protein HMPREF9243_0483 [Aerococcus sp. Group 1]MCY3031234.1 DUF975 family protein [Aerococcus sp. Group 1]MCY3054898.1 DUF975 family protein [Aerococcus sp. Group 1]MCY3056628.1 DUF975 family protein [Aerococcus sp. Group 1]MCY3062125.1 DUF975 family protein [Aerococcus sp. Group 1]